MTVSETDYPRFIARGSLWPPALGWYMCLPMIILSVATLIGLYRSDQSEWAPIPLANLVMFLVAFGKTAVAHTEFYNSGIKVMSLVGSTSVRSYSEITAIDCYDNGIVIRFESHRRIKVILSDDAREFLRFLSALAPNAKVNRKYRVLFNTWHSHLIKKPPIWDD